MDSALFRSLQHYLPHLIDAAARGAIVLLAALVITTLLRRRSAAARHAVWVGAIAAQLLMLALATWGPRWRVAAPEPVSALVPVAAEVSAQPVRTTGGTGVRTETSARTPAEPSVAAPANAVAPSVQARSAPLAPAAPSRWPSGRTLLGVMWALGALAVLVRLAVGTAVVARLARRGDRIDDGGWLSLTQRLASTLRIQRPLILMRGDRIGVPITWGIVYPVVLLPDDADGWPEERRRFVLVHEMAHVKRLDALTQLVGQVALALFWFDPLVWLATRRMQLEREHACDDYVLRHGTQPSRYANDLLEMVRALGTPAHRGAQPAFAALAMARRSEFEGRMLSILDPVLDRHPLSRGRTLMSALATLLVIVPLAALQPYRPAAQSAATSAAAATGATSATSTTSATSDTTNGSRAAARTDRPLAQRLQSLDSTRTALGARLGGGVVSSAGRGASVSLTNDNDSCDAAQFGGSSSASYHLHDNVDDHGARDTRMLVLDHDRCVEVKLRGKFAPSAKEDEIVSLAPGSRVYLRERTATENREMTYTPAASGSGSSVAASYRRNGIEAPLDGAARAWLAKLLPDILAEMQINVAPRVARWRAEGGTDAALKHIAELRSSGAKRAHYEAVLDEKSLSSADARRVAQQAGRTLSSSGDLRAVLSKAAPQIRASGGSTSALEDAIGAVASSGDRSAVLELYGQTADRDMLLAVMRIALTIPSSGDKANLLSSLAPNYLAKNDAALRDAFFKAAATIPSSGDLASVLDDIVPFAVKSNDVALAVIATSKHVASSGDRSSVLVTLADSGAVRSAAARDAYLRAAQELPSSSDMRSALEALTRH